MVDLGKRLFCMVGDKCSAETLPKRKPCQKILRKSYNISSRKIHWLHHSIKKTVMCALSQVEFLMIKKSRFFILSQSTTIIPTWWNSKIKSLKWNICAGIRTFLTIVFTFLTKKTLEPVVKNWCLTKSKLMNCRFSWKNVSNQNMIKR